MKSLNTKIWLAVLVIHFLGIIFFSSTSSQKKPSPKKLVVITKEFVQKTESVPVVTKIETKPLPQINSIKKVTAVKKTTPLKKAKTDPKTSKQVLKKIDQRKPKLPIIAPKKESVVSPTTETESHSSYLESAFVIFKNTLILPEKGPVKLTLTVGPTGKIDKIITESFASQKNLNYLLELLPHLILPSPAKNQEATFTVLFTNE
jgi:hypothetical protein